MKENAALSLLSWCHLNQRSKRQLQRCAVAMIGLGVAGCSTSQDRVGRVLVAPGKYAFYDCQQLAGTAAALDIQAKNLQTLMAKAKQGPGGSLVSALSYEPDYHVNRGEAEQVYRTQIAKKCLPEPAKR
jgi:hypothetical protein